METRSDSNRRHRDRRTACEIFFDETPLFSDSEDETEHYHLNIEQLVNQQVRDKSVTENNKQLQCNTLVDEILKVCCSKCICCHKIQDVVNLSQTNSISARSRSLSSCDSGFGMQQYVGPMEMQIFANSKGNASNKINISDCTLGPVSAIATAPTKRAVLSSNNDNLKKIIDEYSQTQSKMVSPAATAKGGEHEVQAEEICVKRRRSRPPKRKRTMENQGLGELEIKDKRETEAQEIGHPNEHKRKSVKLSEKTKNFQILNQHHINEVHADEHKENVCKTKGPDAKRRRTLGLSSQDNDSLSKSLSRKRLDFDKNRDSQKENTEDIRNYTKNTPARTRPKRKSAAGTGNNEFNTKGKDDGSPDWKTKSLITFGDYEPRRSSRTPRPCKQFAPDVSKNDFKPKDSNKKKILYSMIDRRIFKIPIDTTNDRGFAKAIARKLARRAGSSINLESLSIEHESFRFQKTQKVKKLYSPEAWLNSRIFSAICKCD